MLEKLDVGFHKGLILNPFYSSGILTNDYCLQTIWANLFADDTSLSCAGLDPSKIEIEQCS